MFRPAPAILWVGVVKYQVQFFKKSVVKIKNRAKYLVKMSWCLETDEKMGSAGSCAACLFWVTLFDFNYTFLKVVLGIL